MDRCCLCCSLMRSSRYLAMAVVYASCSQTTSRCIMPPSMLTMTAKAYMIRKNLLKNGAVSGSRVYKSTRSSADADNRLDAFSGQSRSTNMVQFHMLHIVSYCAIVTLCLRRAVFTIFVLKKFHDLEMGSKVTQGH